MFIFSIASSSAPHPPRRTVPLLAQGDELGPGEGLRDPALGLEVLDVALAPLLVEEGLLELDPLLHLGRHLDLELGPPQVGPGLGRLLLELEQLHAEVDLLLLDLLLRLRELGPLLRELALDHLGVEPQDALALLHRLALGGEERDLEVHLGHGGHPDLGRPHRRELALHLHGQDEVGLLHLDGRAHVGARGPEGQEEEGGRHEGDHEPPPPPDAPARAHAGQKRETRSPSASPDSTTHSTGVQAASRTFASPPPARRTTGPSFSKRTAPRGTLRALSHAAPHHLDAHREAGPHQRVGAGEGDAHREARLRRRGEPAPPPALPRHRADLLEASLEDAVRVGVEDAAGLHPGGDPPVVRLGEGGLLPPSPWGRGSCPTV